MHCQGASSVRRTMRTIWSGARRIWARVGPGSAREGQREVSRNRIGAIIPPWRGVPDATSVDRKSRSLDRFTGNSLCSRAAIWGWPAQPTRPIRADRRIPVRAPPSAQRFRSIRCARPTRPRPVRIRRKWLPEAPRLEEQKRGRWIAECAWVLWFNPKADVHLDESAHSSVTECDVALVDMRAVLRKDGYKVYGESTSSCLPDTVDPRGAKGKWPTR